MTTVVLGRDGRLHLAKAGMAPEDAERWAHEGYTVFMIAAKQGQWVMKCVNTGKFYSSLVGEAQETVVQGLDLLTFKGG